MTAIGLFMLVCGTTRSEFLVYRFLVARSEALWGRHVHRFYQCSGVAVMIMGVLMALKIIGR